MTAQPDGTTPPPPRDGKGRYLRAIESIDRDRHAAELITLGWRYDAVAEHLGYSDRGTCHRAVQRVRREAAQLDGTSEQLRQQQLAEMAELKRRLWDRLNNPIPAIDRLGRIVTDENGDPIPDASAIAAAEAGIIRANERIARIRGTDAPRKSLTYSGQAGPQDIAAFIQSLNPEDLAAATDILRQQIEQAVRDAEIQDQAPTVPAIPGTIEP